LAGVVYGLSYLFLLLKFDLFTIDEKLAIGRWTERFTSVFAKAGAPAE
jgi:hypothetical protein